MLTIHGRANSSNVQLVMWAVAELGLPHRRIDVGHVHGGTDTPAFRAMNPNGLVPVLEDGGITIFESGAILRYLGAAYGDDGFWPRDAGRRAALDQWAEWGKVTFAPALSPILYALVRSDPGKLDRAALAGWAASLEPLARMLDARLGDRSYLDGAELCWADIAVGYQLYRYFTLPFARADLPALAAYYTRLQTRPAFRDHAMVSYEGLRWKPANGG